MVDARNLLAGPRGRRLLLAFALMSERVHEPDHNRWVLLPAVSWASYQLDPGRGVSRKLVFPGTDAPGLPLVSPEDVAMLLADVPLAEVTPVGLRTALAEAVDNARYWQEPDGEDVLAATAPVRSALQRVAQHIADAQHSLWWDTGVRWDEQWTVQWTDRPGLPATVSAADLIAYWRAQVPLWEERALRERRHDPAANYSGEWWSIPPPGLPRSSRMLFDGSPAGLWFVEDGSGEESAITVSVGVPAGVRVFEITRADAWVDLCRRFPLDVSAEKRHDWYRTTGRAGKWAIPDWSLVSQHYEGVHLTVAGYLAAAGTAIPVDANIASTIAGWNPDETWWFVDMAYAGELVRWVRYTTGEDKGWHREGGAPASG